MVHYAYRQKYHTFLACGCGTQQRSAKNEEETAKKYMRFWQVWCKMKEEKGCEAVLCRRVCKIEN